MRRDRLWTGTLGIATLALVTLGCENTAKGVKQDTEKNAEAAKPYVDAAAEKAKQKLNEAAENAKPAAEKAGEKLKELGDKAVEGAKELGDKAAEGAHKAGEKVKEGADKAGDKTASGAEKAEDKTSGVGDTLSAAKQTTVVKAALMVDKNVDSSHIDVDTDADTKTVMLKGTVPTAAQKTAAERIARAKVSKGYSVHNMLTVAKP
jgi:osmotically-inducible protein OsmY